MPQEMEKIHGFPIVGEWRMPSKTGLRDGRVVMVDRGVRNPPEDPRYVIAAQYQSDGKWDHEWDHGEYITDQPRAIKAFFDRVEHHFYVRTGTQVES